MRLLIVEDEAGLVSALEVALRREGYAVDHARTVGEARDKLALSPYDLVLLDVNLPDGTGFDLTRAVRAGQVPLADGDPPRILMLTARGRLTDRVTGLDVGADDYLVKPFAIIELSARIRALLRREAREVAAAVLTHGPIRLDAARQLAWRGARELALTRKEFAVLRYLMSRPAYVVPAEELLEHVWDENADPFTQTVRVTVGTLRRKLTVDDEEPALETVIGRGYRLRELPAPIGGVLA
ncbi:response regulator transcription factor [Promicromonospora thailandica]|uniref:DNA-binding response regulator, OmpR family, contains REC and winged-helix (WHTH) domain n=1 Tax=Promicromonospora thailandica TaxID=765201 RepID=A0A9X2FZZ4_9MICO|nr:response regulator transcription factor [Promicromonospora thailandica]MCP2262692.1 DNA-binding response regulator, OmpR family, contains REC and winged-helix (wHTH) domain [Promicromonospora thailandica]BFF18012.1 response regulator transcription factor [Promicromonospora thailandica]